MFPCHDIFEILLMFSLGVLSILNPIILPMKLAKSHLESGPMFAYPESGWPNYWSSYASYVSSKSIGEE